MSRAGGVSILLSTHNGARFLDEQLRSFLAQSFRDWVLCWRDDASTDETPALMRDFAAGEGAGRVIDLNDNHGWVGITASFLGLLRRVPNGRFVAFADQDDVWLPEKLARGMAALEAVPDTVPALYCGRQILVDAELRHLRVSPPVPHAPGFPQAMTQNIATGCTVMLNPSAIALLKEAAEPPETLHDWWAYLMVAAAGGKIVFDNEPSVMYRQHDHNAVGVPLSPRKRAWAAMRRGPRIFMRMFRANMAGLEARPDLLAPGSRATLATISQGLHDGWPLRLKALAHPGLKRQSWAETQLFRLWFLLG